MKAHIVRIQSWCPIIWQALGHILPVYCGVCVCVCAVPHSYSRQRGLRVHLPGKMKIWDVLMEAESSSKYAQA